MTSKFAKGIIGIADTYIGLKEAALPSLSRTGAKNDQKARRGLMEKAES